MYRVEKQGSYYLKKFFKKTGLVHFPKKFFLRTPIQSLPTTKPDIE
jgi:hypothetical protein